MFLYYKPLRILPRYHYMVNFISAVGSFTFLLFCRRCSISMKVYKQNCQIYDILRWYHTHAPERFIVHFISFVDPQGVASTLNLYTRRAAYYHCRRKSLWSKVVNPWMISRRRHLETSISIKFEKNQSFFSEWLS